MFGSTEKVSHLLFLFFVKFASLDSEPVFRFSASLASAPYLFLFASLSSSPCEATQHADKKK